MAHALAYDGEGDVAVACGAGPGVACDVHGEVVLESDERHDFFQFGVDEVLRALVLRTFVGRCTADDGQEVGGWRCRVFVEYGLHVFLPSHEHALAGLLTAVGEEAVCEVGLLEVGHVDEGHATGVEAEEEHVAGIVEEWAGGEIELFHSGDVLYGDSAFDGTVDPGVDVAERVFLFGDAFLDGAVVDGTQAAHVGGDGVHGYAAGLEVGFVFGDGVGVDVFDADVAPVAETAETVERGFVGFACADFVETAQSGDGGLHEGVETVAGRAHGGEGCGEGVGCADDVLMVVEVGEFGEEGQVGAEALAGVGEVAET